MNERLVNWTPTHSPRRWQNDRDEFLAWTGQPIRSPWKRRRFTRWAEERRIHARALERERREQRLANPSPELIAAHVDLRAAEQETGGTLMCARGTDFTDPAAVRALARLLREAPAPRSNLHP
ncbi:hypothetical protein [Prescottella agglutinans]|uniref:Uncharacterized protein n=1 Tax=Prescottella agglutinans TaxID=1644129 RepID=A0ABT6MLC4_9NOCA|nr:hypothetical protein [Prescottella agglutinans]MDH6284571.1 hypothetical protein [Prescottella agglutinans]